MAERDGRPRQLPLDLPASPALRREDFLAAPGNAAALTLIDAFPEWPARVVCIVGPEGAGKSHLSAIFAERSGARILDARALTREGVPEALATGALVLEDLEAGTFSEAALFHLLNLAREQQAYLLMTARTPPSSFSLATADLASRLRAVPVFEIAPADDALLAAVLVKLFADRQLSVDEATVQYLLMRMQRTVAGAKRIVDALDTAALAARRPVTRTLAAQVLKELGEDPGEAPSFPDVHGEED
ncbi:UNVERIFIED_ORG: chromosomal replication initiation ATPase DnaA [Xanthobacter viscosus]|jgi:chromosomal replication initiation ATPase DnaA|uniref:Chromosomal replication initiator DnaA n=1 Tax=Xanthobacter autotrophicus TaxID=280 RepID=A0A6C1KH28_XANAU|nr:DnaA/Hda family protein [Xanthobacter autotrophicus]TLX42434.1 chromosomal replication initiator DnaA [Xanthobacter autotrophicus]